ncbi:tim17/Tim22/Tim23/Pmp24 family domain-containing protein [Phthorimaea operculella]|nr:tim17/Tim22/Tim23/Pmp24 family domain-containing protein [Phthorimaea operculella]
MLRTVGRLTPTFIFPLFEDRTGNDVDYINTQRPKAPESGWERVKKMYTRNEYDEHSVELHTVIQSSLMGAFIGACMGGFSTSRQAYMYFIETNQATIFKSTREAQKKLQDYVLIAFAKGAARWGWRLGTFTGLFSLTATTISIYRGDTSLVEYLAAGTLTGAVYRCNLGLAATIVGAGLVYRCNLGLAATIVGAGLVYRSDIFIVQYLAAGTLTGAVYRCNLGLAATIVGAGLGATLSLIAGTAVIGILKATGFSMADIRAALHKVKEAREEQMNQAMEKASEIKNDELTKNHDAALEEKGVIGKKINELVE